jgi:hypothetical protein
MTAADPDDDEGSAASVGPANALSGRRGVGEGDKNRMRPPAGLRQPGRTTLSVRTRACVAGLAIALGQLISGAPATHAQTTGTPTTIWSFMGVPNPFGANAAAQQSPNPAIQAAAKAKAAKHEICKKKAAIQYLAGLGCTPEHPEVMPALLAAMGDPDEQVRYEAVKAVLQTAEVCQSPEQKKATRKAKGMSETCKDWKKACEKQVCDALDRLCGKAPPKEHDHKLKKAIKSKLGGECDDPSKEDCPCADRRGACCSPEMRDKLMKLAYGRDDMGCFLEPSKRVRDLAEQAFNACNACACGCEGAMGAGSGNDNVVREMPPVDDRETRPSDSVGMPCYEDRLVVPPQMNQHEMVPTPAPLPAPEMIPSPAALVEPPGTRSVLVRAPAAAEPIPTAVARLEPVWRPLDPAAPFTDADAANVEGFLGSIHSARPASQPAGVASQARRHAEARLALVPTAPTRGLHQPIARPMISGGLSPRNASTSSTALRDVVPWAPIDLRALMTGAVVLPESGPWPALPPEDPLDEVRRITGRTTSRAPAPSSRAPSPSAPTRAPPIAPPPAAPPAATAPPRSPPPPGPTAGIRPAPVATTAPAAAKPPAGGLAPGSRRPDALDWLALAGVVAALAIILFDWPGSPQPDSPPPAPRTSGMMRHGPPQHRRKQR